MSQKWSPYGYIPTMQLNSTLRITPNSGRQVGRTKPPPDPNPGLSKLQDAVKAGDYDLVTQLVPEDPPLPSHYLLEALWFSATWNQVEIARFLLDRGARFDQPGDRSRPARMAALGQHLPILKLFKEYGWDVNSDLGSGETALCLALGDSEVITWLLSNGADPNLGPRNINHHDEPPVRGSGYLLNQAARSCNVEQFDQLLASGAVLEDSCALHYASLFSHANDTNDTRLMAHLLDLGVDINEPDDKVDMQKPGRIGAPIFWAIRGGSCTKVRFLVERGADLTTTSPYGKRLPIEEARRTCYQEIIEYLESVSSSHSS